MGKVLIIKDADFSANKVKTVDLSEWVNIVTAGYPMALIVNDKRMAVTPTPLPAGAKVKCTSAVTLGVQSPYNPNYGSGITWEESAGTTMILSAETYIAAKTSPTSTMTDASQVTDYISVILPNG